MALQADHLGPWTHTCMHHSIKKAPCAIADPALPPTTLHSLHEQDRTQNEQVNYGLKMEILKLCTKTINN
eukprot:1232312-Amphidinium_carterae.1